MMSLAENLLNSLDNSARLSTGEEPHIVVGEDRVITVPQKLKLIAVKGDKDIETVTIDCVRFWDGHDLATFSISIYYTLPNGKTSTYTPNKKTIYDDYFSFDWLIGQKITSYVGGLKFWVVAQQANANGVISRQWSSLKNSEMSIADGGTFVTLPDSPDNEEEITKITFTIAGTSYEADEGMTWREWVNSDYNVDNFDYIGDYGYIAKTWDVETDTGEIVSYNGTPVLEEGNTIVANRAYTLTTIETEEPEETKTTTVILKNMDETIYGRYTTTSATPKIAWTQNAQGVYVHAYDDGEGGVYGQIYEWIVVENISFYGLSTQNDGNVTGANDIPAMQSADLVAGNTYVYYIIMIDLSGGSGGGGSTVTPTNHPFYINGDTYYKSSMSTSWEDWVGSTYNTGGFFIDTTWGGEGVELVASAITDNSITLVSTTTDYNGRVLPKQTILDTGEYYLVTDGE